MNRRTPGFLVLILLCLVAVLGGCTSEAGEDEQVTASEDPLVVLPPPNPPINLQIPRLTTVTPSSGPAGTVVIIEGTNITRYGAFTLSYGGANVSYVVLPNSQRIQATVPNVPGSHTFRLTYNLLSLYHPESQPFDCVVPTTGTFHLVSNAQYMATSIVVDGTELIPGQHLPAHGEASFTLSNGPHFATVKLGANTALQSWLFTFTSSFTIVGGQTTTVTMAPLALAPIITSFQPSAVFQLVPVPSGVSYTIRQNGSWDWTNGSGVWSGPSLSATSWPDNALVIGFRFSDGTPATFDVLSGTFVANGNEAYAR